MAMQRRRARRAGPLGALQAGQLVVRIADGELLEVLEVDPRRGRCRLEDDSWARPREIESPLRASYRWDLERGRREAERQQAIERGDFGAVFPGLGARPKERRPRLSFTWLAAIGWALAVVEGTVLFVLLA